jgi:DNA topoisomerase-2
MYIGSTEKQQLNTWVFDGGKMEKMTVECVPAMLKLFDEILVNAADNKQRDPEMSRIDIHIDTTTPALPVITIENDGKGIPVAIHELEGMHVPELIFGHLLTGSNFNDTRDRFTGGRHGYGAKLTNIFSKLFEVTTYDKKRGLLFKQVRIGNISVCFCAHWTIVRARTEMEREHAHL